MKLNRIDVHAHYVPPGTVPRANSAQNFVSSPMPRWTPEFALDFMDRHDIATQMLSLPSHLSKEEARTINEYGAMVGKQYPELFGLLAALPMDDVEATLSEIAFAFDQLNAEGVIMVTNYSGSYLGNARFEPVFAELNKRSATIFIHPINPAGYECVACGRPGPVIEFTFDTCRSVTDMLYAGVSVDTAISSSFYPTRADRCRLWHRGSVQSERCPGLLILRNSRKRQCGPSLVVFTLIPRSRAQQRR